jgi:mono/diheme cytochrome c family protein
MTKRQALKGIIATLGAIALLASFLAALMLVSRGIRVRSPGKWETKIMTAAKHRLLVGNKDLKNPLRASSENTAAGQQAFSHYCFACHGLDGQNTGVPFAEAMSPPVPSLVSRDIQNYTDGQLYWVIRNGLWPSGMPASRGILTEEEIWAIVTYVRNLPGEGSLGEPSAYNGEGCTAATGQESAPESKERKSRPPR